MLAHTRWASVGIISEANAHPLNQEELDVASADYVAAALNGDVDNYADLKALEALRFPAEITTDAKVIPALVSRRIANGAEPIEAFRATVAGVRGFGRDRGADRGRSGPGAARAAGQRPGAVRRRRRRRVRRRERAVRRRRGVRPLPPARRRDDARARASPARRARSSAVERARPASSGGRTTGRRCRSPTPS